MLKGIDVSNNNDYAYVNNTLLDYFSKGNIISFMFIKVSEGVTYQDQEAGKFLKLANYLNILPGFYHFARAERNAAKDEAQNFLSCVKALDADRFFLALDVEAYSLDNPNLNAWIDEFYTEVSKEVSNNLILYMSLVPALKIVKNIDDNIGLWIASWGKSISSQDKEILGREVAFRQTGIEDNIDQNIFFGDGDQLAKYLCSWKQSAINDMIGVTINNEIKGCQKDVENFLLGLTRYLLIPGAVKKGKEYIVATETSSYKGTVVHTICLDVVNVGPLSIVTFDKLEEING